MPNAANYWTPEFRSRLVEGFPAMMGMVKLDLTKAPDASTGLGATADNIADFVADFAMGNSNAENMLATSLLWDEKTHITYKPTVTEGRSASGSVRETGDPRNVTSQNGRSASGTVRDSSNPVDTRNGNAIRMAKIMKKQAAADPASHGITAIVALPDTIGLTVDLNIQRLAFESWAKVRLTRKYQREIATNALLDQFETSLNRFEERFNRYVKEKAKRVMATAHTLNNQVVSLESWNRSVQQGEGSGHCWQALPDLKNTRVSNPGFIISRTEVDQQWMEGKLYLDKIQGLMDTKKRDAWKAQCKEEFKADADDGVLYETDWLAMIKAENQALSNVFATHWDPDARNDPNAVCPVDHGQLYMAEAEAAYTPQPVNGEELTRQYVAATLEPNSNSYSAVFLRALAGNQNDLLTQAHDYFSGEPLRENDNNARDKARDILSGLVSETGLTKYRWVAAASAGFSFGLLSAVVAAAGSLARSNQDALKSFAIQHLMGSMPFRVELDITHNGV